MGEEGRVEVVVNGKAQSLYRGMQVRHALIACDQALYEAVLQGDALVEDGDGFPLGLEGALTAGMIIRTRQAGG
jgi:hypothetical protein